MLAVLVVAAFLCAILSGVLGMAGGLLLMTVAAWALPVSGAMVFHGSAQLVSNGARAAVLRRHVRWDVIAWHAAGSLVAFGAVRLVRFEPPRAAVLIALGCVPFAARLLPRSGLLDATRPGSAFACGLVTMSVQLLAGVAGPLLDAWYVETPLDRRSVVATKAAKQALSHLLKVTHFVPLMRRAHEGGEVSALLLALTAVGTIAGTRLGTLLLDRLSDVHFRSITRQVVLVLGVVSLAQGAIALAPGPAEAPAAHPLEDRGEVSTIPGTIPGTPVGCAARQGVLNCHAFATEVLRCALPCSPCPHACSRRRCRPAWISKPRGSRSTSPTPPTPAPTRRISCSRTTPRATRSC